MREGLGRVGEGDEAVGAAGRGVVEHRGEVGGAGGIGHVVDHLEAGVGERRPRRGDEVDAEAVGDRDHRHLLVDLALLGRLREQAGERVGVVVAAAEQPVALRPALHELRRLVGHRRDRELRIAEAVEERRRREVEAGAPRRQDEVDLVLVRQPLDGAHHLLGGGAVVVLDDLDRQLRAVGQRQPAGVVHLLHPELVVRQRGDACAAGVRPGLRDGVADLDRRAVLAERRQGRRGREQHGGQAEGAQRPPGDRGHVSSSRSRAFARRLVGAVSRPRPRSSGYAGSGSGRRADSGE